MDTKKLLHYSLAVLPLVAVALAGVPNAVTVYDTTNPQDIALSCSFFTLLEDVPAGVCLPYAGILGALTFGLAVLWLVTKKKTWLAWIAGAAFGATTLAVAPLLLGGDVMLLPNMLVPILLGITCVLAFGLYKAPVQEEAPKGERLGK